MKQILKTVFYLTLLAIFITASLTTVVYLLAPKSSRNSSAPGTQQQTWTCSMHPHIKQPQPGKCPICHMALIPLSKDDAVSGSALTLSPRATKLADIETVRVEPKNVSVEVRLNGKIRYDETRMDKLSAHFPGRIEKLFVNYTGMLIHKGDHIAELFSPELAVLQRELQVTHATLQNQKQATKPRYLKEAERSYESVKKKMKLWGLIPKQINRMLTRKNTLENVVLYAPISGVVTHKNIIEGQYFKTGDPLLTIADTRYLWVILDAYELDMPWLKLGQPVSFAVAAYPGERFSGRIVYISPEVDERTRTIKVRANIENKGGRLKPGMFVKAVVYSRIDAAGRVLENSLAGKWISPMHPEIIKDKKGQCDICGIDLVPAEALGFVTTSSSSSFPPLVVPASAPLITGQRAVVYVKTAPGTYEGRTITLGPRAGQYYIVKKGLKAGEEVVTNGNFKIDSALQIKAKPSMMTLPDGSISKSEQPLVSPFQYKVDELLKAYYRIHHFLSRDNLPESHKALVTFQDVLKTMAGSTLAPAQAQQWQTWRSRLSESVEQALAAGTIKDVRSRFATISHILYDIIKQLGPGGTVSIYKHFCPMVGEKGEFWLQDKKELENPYYGAEMFHCGVMQETLKEATEPAGKR